jgi:signal transduction histidine kinase
MTQQGLAVPTLSSMKAQRRALASPRRQHMATGRAKITDRLIAAGLLAWAATDVPWWWRPPGHGAATPVVLGFVLLMLTQSVPFLWWRRWPLLAAALAVAVLAIRTALGLNPFSAAAATLVGAFGLGAWGGRQLRLAARILTVAAVVGAGAVLVTSNGFRAQALPLALLATALGLGEVTAANRDAATASARLVHDQERARIARELHDVLSHQLSAIAIQAGAARIASRDDPGVAAQVVGSIEDIAREGLTDLNRIVGALRRDADEQLDRRPQPRLSDLPDLVAGARAAGLPVELDMSGLPESLPASVELAAYRVVQESLTNALRYAQAPTRVRLAYTGAGLDLLVEDDGPGPAITPATATAAMARVAASAAPPHAPPAPGVSQQHVACGGGGRGLAGLTERAQILGGSLHAGPRPGGGFAVHAWLPARQ